MTSSMATKDPDYKLPEDLTLSDVIPTHLSEFVNPKEEQAVLQGTIIDIGSINPTNPLGNFKVDEEDVAPASKQFLEGLIQRGDLDGVLILVIELDCGECVLDPFKLESSDLDYPLLEGFCAELGVEFSEVNKLIGESVHLTKDGQRWTIPTMNKLPKEKQQTSPDQYINPLVISSSIIPLSFLIGWQTGLNIVLTTTFGAVIAIVSYIVLLYVGLVPRRDGRFPWMFGSIYLPDYSSEAVVDDSNVVDVENGEFKRLDTSVPEEEEESERAALYNMVAVVEVPPIGEIEVPIRTPVETWYKSTCAQLIFSLSSSSDNLYKARGESIPLKLVEDDDERYIKIDQSRFEAQIPEKEKQTIDRVSDTVLGTLNKIFRGKHRRDVYDYAELSDD